MKSMKATNLKSWPIGKPISLRNLTCAFCGHAMAPGTRTRDHFIGRRFVPKRKPLGQTNLTVYAHRQCNLEKADLEGEFSALSLHLLASSTSRTIDTALSKDIARKDSGAISTRTRRAVRDSYEHDRVKIQVMRGVTASFRFTAPPQADSQRAFCLARLHVLAFFHWLTFDPVTRRGGFPLGGFCPIMISPVSDWGNAVQRSLMMTVASWKTRLAFIGAEGFFKIAIRRHPAWECWSWAVEWNQSYRIIGLFGDPSAAQSILDTLPSLPMTELPADAAPFRRYRVERRLDQTDDILFSP